MWPDKVGLKEINNKNKQTNKHGQASSVARHSSWKEVPVCSSVSRSSSRRASGGGGGACEELAGTELCTWEFSYIHTRAGHADSAFAVSSGYLHKHFRYPHTHLDFSKPASILYSVMWICAYISGYAHILSQSHIVLKSLIICFNIWTAYSAYGSVSAGREKWPFNVIFFFSSCPVVHV